MLIQIEKTSGPTVGAHRSARSRFAPGARHKFLSSCRAALLDISAVLAAFLLVTATGLGLAFALFVAFFVKL